MCACVCVHVCWWTTCLHRPKSISVLVVPVSVPGPYQFSLSINGQLFYPDDDNVGPGQDTTFEFFPPFSIYTTQLYSYVTIAVKACV